MKKPPSMGGETFRRSLLTCSSDLVERVDLGEEVRGDLLIVRAPAVLPLLGDEILDLRGDAAEVSRHGLVGLDEIRVGRCLLGDESPEVLLELGDLVAVPLEDLRSDLANLRRFLVEEVEGVLHDPLEAIVECLVNAIREPDRTVKLVDVRPTARAERLGVPSGMLPEEVDGVPLILLEDHADVSERQADIDYVADGFAELETGMLALLDRLLLELGPSVGRSDLSIAFHITPYGWCVVLQWILLFF